MHFNKIKIGNSLLLTSANKKKNNKNKNTLPYRIYIVVFFYKKNELKLLNRHTNPTNEVINIL